MDNSLFPELNNPDIEEPLLDPEPETIQEPESDGYEFATGDLSSFMHSFSEDKENMEIEQLPTPEEFQEVGKTPIPPATARKTGKFVANMVDYTLATGLSLIDEEPVDSHKADSESKKELESIITEYIKETGGEIPLFAQLIICLLVTYGLQVPGAIMIRKQKHGKTS